MIQVWQAGCRWQDCPPEYGPSTTVYNRITAERSEVSGREYSVI
ncbi:MAG: hypothetical protein JSS39_05310 [Nitrospira sp.]|nr:hypothetical protein [Nitrospira sp.]